MAKSKATRLDLGQVQSKLKSQFTGLDPNDPSQWPAIPRNLLFLGVCAAVVAALWFLWLKDVDAELVADARSLCSHSMTFKPRPAASRAMPAPLMPPPMTRRS